MTPDEHVAAAEALALDADELLRTAAGGSLAERMQAAETARAMAAVGRLLVDLSVVRQTRQDLGWEHLATGPALGIAAPVYDLPMRADKRRAPADDAAEAPDQHPRKD